MNVLIIAPPFLKNENDQQSWLMVPPWGYGGIENVIYSLINGLIYHRCNVTLIGTPGSNSINGLTVVRDVRGAKEINSWINTHKNSFDIIHDHSCGLVFNENAKINFRYIATHHQTGKTPYPKNSVFVSYAQRNQANDNHSPVIRLPIMFDNFIFNKKKDNYFLYMGRVSEFKGVVEAASICEKLKAKLIIAGPNWEKEYFNNLVEKYSQTVEYVGEVFGLKKLDLLSKAKAVFVLSRFSEGPWGNKWCEPGATIVGEATASGTPIISSTNGCLTEIVVSDIGLQLEEKEIYNFHAELTANLPNPIDVFNYSKNNWNHIFISEQYLGLYKKIVLDLSW